MTIEYRSLTGASDVSSDEGRISGLAIPYNREAVIGDLARYGFREKIAAGACTKSINEADIACLLNHNADMPLGRTSAGNLSLDHDQRGVHPDVKPTDTSYARDLMTNVKAGVIRGWSFGFEVTKEDWFDDDGDRADPLTGTNRVIREMKLREVSPVTFPAYGADTNIAARDARGIEPARERADSSGSSGGSPKPYGNVTYADPKNGKYPIDTKAHVKAAWSYINMPKNAAKYPLNGVSLSSVKAKIKAAASKLGIDISEDNAADLAEVWRTELTEAMALVFAGHRDDPDGKEYALIDHAVTLLEKGQGDAALALMKNEQKNRGPDDGAADDSDDEPDQKQEEKNSEPDEATTPEDDPQALVDLARAARARELERELVASHDYRH